MLKLVIPVIILISYYNIFATHEYSLSPREDYLTTPRLSRNEDNHCPPWMYYNVSSQRCKCYDDLDIGSDYIARCNEQESLLGYNYCMTYDERSGTSTVSYCPYFTLQGRNISGPRFISLPDNISALNQYMCGPMNRKGTFCSECIDGYGPSLTSLKFQCSTCRSVWYGVLLYLLLELIPVTILYIALVIFKIRLTTAPMTSLIFFSNYFSVWINIHPVVSNENQSYAKVTALLYGIWNLDFFRFSVPPFCISPKLRAIHIIYLQCLSTLTPFVLIAFTWLLIELHSNDCKVVVWMWKMLSKLTLKCINVQRNSTNRTVINAFATFFLLSFAKLSVTFLLPLIPHTVIQVNNYNFSESRTIRSFVDVRVGYAKGANLTALLISSGIFLFALLPPVFIIALYPIRIFRNLLFKCCHRQFICRLNFFVDEYHFCYKDGLDGGKDMRSFASMYFFTTILLYAMWSIGYNTLYLAILFGVCSLTIAIVQPYKKQYMTIIDSLILANLALATAASEKYDSLYFRILFKICTVLPALGFILFACFRLLKKPSLNLYRTIKENSTRLILSLQIHMKSRHSQKENGSQDEPELQLPDRVVHPEIYVKDKKTEMANT